MDPDPVVSVDTNQTDFIWVVVFVVGRGWNAARAIFLSEKTEDPAPLIFSAVPLQRCDPLGTL